MTSVPGTENLVWSDEQTRFYLQLRVEEKLKGNIRQQHVNETARTTIIEKFSEEFGETHLWKKFGTKITSCKKVYDTFKRLTNNRTGLGYLSNGALDMSEDWWKERCKEWPGASRFKSKPVPNMDLMEEVFGNVHISGAEGWSAQQGEQHLDTMHLLTQEADDDDDDAESRQVPPTQEAPEVDGDAESREVPPTQRNGNGHPSSSNIGNGRPSSSNIGNGPSSSSRPRAGKKRSREQAVAEVIRDSVDSRDKILSHKNGLIEKHPEFSCCQLRAMEVLHSLPSIRMWSPLYKAAIQHLKQDVTNRQTFLFYGDDENKVLYLEFATGESREA